MSDVGVSFHGKVGRIFSEGIPSICSAAIWHLLCISFLFDALEVMLRILVQVVFRATPIPTLGCPLALPSQAHIALDDPHFDYLLVLIGADRAMVEKALLQQPTQDLTGGSSTRPGARVAAATAAAGGSGFASGAAGSSAGNSGLAAGMGIDAGVLASMISQIKDVLPDYGDGFLTACLVAYKHDPAQVWYHG